MKKSILTILISLAATINCYSGDDFSFTNEFKKRKLLIALQEENPKTIEELNKKGKQNLIESYKANVKRDNEITKKVFTEYWKDTPIEFILESKITSLTEDELSKSAIMMHEAASNEGVEFMYYNIAIIQVLTNKKGNKSYDKYDKFFKVSLEDDVVSYADLLLLTKKMKTLFDYDKQFDQTQLNTKLASKTLLIDKESCELSEEDMKSNYDFPFKLVSRQELLESKNSKDPKTLYVKVDLYAGMPNFLIIDSENGQVIARSTIAGLVKVSFNGPSGSFNSNGQLATISEKASNRVTYNSCMTCGISGGEIIRLYTAKAKLKKAVIRVLNNQKQQIKFYSDLTPY
ncbi:MAG: hypothetical protein H0U95_13450 [Bacteroidetes bacterium]|nr:hypothetical protein [Bacteroidota bacterium]